MVDGAPVNKIELSALKISTLTVNDVSLFVIYMKITDEGVKVMTSFGVLKIMVISLVTVAGLVDAVIIALPIVDDLIVNVSELVLVITNENPAGPAIDNAGLVRIKSFPSLPIKLYAKVYSLKSS